MIKFHLIACVCEFFTNFTLKSLNDTSVNPEIYLSWSLFARKTVNHFHILISKYQFKNILFKRFVNLRNMEGASFRSQIKDLKESFKNGEKFVLFVGAGQNVSAKVHLLWGDLIREVSRISFNNILREFNASTEDINAILEAMEFKKIEESFPKKAESEEKAEKKGITQTTEFDSEFELAKFINTHFPVEVQVSMIKDLLKGQYIPELQKKIYDECNYDIIKKSFFRINASKSYNYENINPRSGDNYNAENELYTLYIIARMILLNPQIESIITYNFDNFISRAVKVLLKYKNDFFSKKELAFLQQRYSLFVKEGEDLSDRIKVIDVHDNKYNSAWKIPVGSFPVYHVHGYIPDTREEEIVDSSNIVMALEDFVEQLTDGLSWQDAVQVKAFRDSNIIFIGCSMTDLTMKRMLNFAHSSGYRNKIYILDASSGPKQDDNQDKINFLRRKSILNNLRKRYFESLGATFINCPTGFKELCDALYEITYPNLKQ